MYFLKKFINKFIQYVIQSGLNWDIFHRIGILTECTTIISPNLTVLHGPFRGMRYPEMRSVGSALFPKILGSYERENKRNDFSETSQETSLIQRYTGKLTWNKKGKGSLRSSFSWVKIDFTGDPSTYLAYLLLDALQPGTNQTWQINWQQKMSKGMQLSFLYNGRKSEESKSIHTGNVQVTAYF